MIEKHHAPPGMLRNRETGGYVDVREFHPTVRVEECHNCGLEWYRRGHPVTVCPRCFMGNREGDEDTDYRELWYGEDVSLEEAHRRYRDKTADMDVGNADVTVADSVTDAASERL
jgi:hypothetical protein